MTPPSLAIGRMKELLLTSHIPASQRGNVIIQHSGHSYHILEALTRWGMEIER